LRQSRPAAPPAAPGQKRIARHPFHGYAKGASLLISIDQTIENNFFQLASLF
jgi:hypothetical protein